MTDMAQADLTRLLLAAVVTSVLAAAAGFLNLTQLLGAHPFWSAKVLWIGMPIGIGLGAALWAVHMSRSWRVVLGGAGLGVAGLAAHFGKVRFAASFAEDRLAGKFWYFGWIGVAVFAAFALMALLLATRQDQA